ncbi:MAG TPA: DUF2000 family protein [Candidatus Paceibacterota bacterium]|nr:DUF2000 family protein [Candidatus Paceibacterota bacterium]
MKNASVLIVNEKIDHKGILTNAAFVLGLTAGRMMEEAAFGPEVIDGDGSPHTYLTNMAHFVRRAGQNKIRTLRKEFLEAGCKVIDYTEDASTSTYSDYEALLQSHKGEEIVYRAIYVLGSEEIVVPKTKSLSSLQ